MISGTVTQTVGQTVTDSDSELEDQDGPGIKF